MNFCICGCGKIVKKEKSYFVGHWNKNRVPWNKGKTGVYSKDTINKWKEVRKGRILSEEHKNKLLGRIPWNKGKTGVYSNEVLEKIKKNRKQSYFSDESREKIRNSKIGKPSWNKGLTKENDFRVKKISDKLIGKNYNSKQHIENSRQRMLNGQASWMNKFIKNPSKSERKLIEITKQINYNFQFQYQILNYSIDIALPEYKIAIEYDGWYHFNNQESIDYHNKRQKEIENEGWKFIRYNIYQKFPDVESVKNSIDALIMKSEEIYE